MLLYRRSCHPLSIRPLSVLRPITLIMRHLILFIYLIYQHFENVYVRFILAHAEH